MNPAPLTVLIVEDDPHVLLGCQQALALEDIACEGVGSAEQALERIGDDFAGIVVSDIPASMALNCSTASRPAIAACRSY
jgi:two-component system response regulator AauR